MKYFLKLSYNGTAYHGWQKQENANSVQETLDNAMSVLIGAPIETVGCGRTDTGVHAMCYFAHFETLSHIPDEFIYQLNSILPHDIAIEDFKPIEAENHARFSALSREYRYFIHSRKDPFLRERSYFLHKKLDIELMNVACKVLREYNDFESFCKKGADNKTTLCEIYEADWITLNHQIIFKIRADRFLRNMVRTIVGTMLDVGLHKISMDEFRQIIEAKDRQFSGSSVPACGLYLWDVKYPGI